jgi:hypothetical protein
MRQIRTRKTRHREPQPIDQHTPSGRLLPF